MDDDKSSGASPSEGWALGSVGTMPILGLAAGSKAVSSSGKKTTSKTSGKSSKDKHEKKETREKKERSPKADRPTCNESGKVTDIIVVKPDGRACKICGVKDFVIDYVNGQIYIKWSRPPSLSKEGKHVNDGYVCYYCNKLFVSQYRDDHKTIDGLATAMGTPPKGKYLTLEVKGFREIIVKACTVQKKYNVRIDLTVKDQARKLVHNKRKVVAIETNDQVWDETYYEGIHGPWRSNGKGHRYGCLEGERGVIVPGPPIKNIRRSNAQEAVLSGVEDDGMIQLTDDAMDKKFDSLGKDIDIPKAVGVSLANFALGAMQGHRVTSDSTSSSSTLPPKTEPKTAALTPAARPETSAGASRGFSMQFGAPAEAEEYAPPAAVVGTSSSKRKAGGSKPKDPPSTPKSTRSIARVPGGSPDGDAASAASVATPKSAGGGGIGGRGRKAEDPQPICNSQVRTFELVDRDDDNFFGKGAKQHKGFLKRLKDRLEVRINTEMCPQGINKCNLTFKEFSTLMDILDFYFKYGIGTKQFHELIETKVAFFKMAPVIEHVPMPIFMKIGHNEYKAINATTNESFWIQLTLENLIAVGIKQDDILPERTRLLKLRIVGVTRSGTIEEAGTTLLDMIEAQYN